MKNTAAHFLLLGTLLLTPLVIIPAFANFMVTSKLLILLVAAVLLVGVFVWQTLQRRVLEIPRSTLVAAVAAFGVAALASSLLASQYPVENLLGLGGAYVAVAVIAVLGSMLLRKKSNQDFQMAFNAMAIILTVLTVSQVLGFGPSRLVNALTPGLNLPNTGLFNVAGAPFVAAQIFALALVANAYAWFRTRRIEVVNIAAAVAAVIGLVVTVPSVLPGQEAAPVLLPAGISWSVAVDVIKEPRSALIGVGPENYSAAYTILKPAWVNGQDWWNTVFGQGFNVPLTLLATTGLIGLAAWLVLAVKIIGQTRMHASQLPFLSSLLIGSLVLQVIFPANVVVLLIQAVALAYFIANIEPGKVSKLHFLKVENNDRLPFNFALKNRPSPLVVALLPIVLAALITGAGLYAVGRAYAASHAFFQSSLALQENDGVRVYELQQQATVLNPYIASYRSNYAMTNMAIAAALANKADVTPQEQEQISSLIQQAIREARAATLLRPLDFQTWQVLAQVYSNLIGSAEDADQWAIQSYVQAINTNPTDPMLRIELGGLFFASQQYEQAVSLFQQAVELKPDLPAAYYNLANALKAAEQWQAAQSVYQQLLALLPADSEDYILVTQELEEVEANIPEEEAGAEGAAGIEETAGNQGGLPSLLNENVNQPAGSLLQPSTESLSGTEPAETQTEPQPTASPTPAE